MPKQAFDDAHIQTQYDIAQLVMKTNELSADMAELKEDVMQIKTMLLNMKTLLERQQQPQQQAAPLYQQQSSRDEVFSSSSNPSTDTGYHPVSDKFPEHAHLSKPASTNARLSAFIRSVQEELKPKADDPVDVRKLKAQKVAFRLRNLKDHATGVCAKLMDELAQHGHDSQVNLGKTWRNLPESIRQRYIALLEDLALQSKIPLNRCIDSWGAKRLLREKYHNNHHAEAKKHGIPIQKEAPTQRNNIDQNGFSESVPDIFDEEYSWMDDFNANPQFQLVLSDAEEDVQSIPDLVEEMNSNDIAPPSIHVDEAPCAAVPSDPLPSSNRSQAGRVKRTLLIDEDEEEGEDGTQVDVIRRRQARGNNLPIPNRKGKLPAAGASQSKKKPRTSPPMTRSRKP